MWCVHGVYKTFLQSPCSVFLTLGACVCCDIQEVRLMVDRCESAGVIDESETGQTSSHDDRRPCELISTTPGHSTIINVNAPLQLGGRSNFKVRYPDNVIRDGFNGCIKNLRHNGLVSSFKLLLSRQLEMYGKRQHIAYPA